MKKVLSKISIALMIVMVLALPLFAFATTESTGGRTHGSFQTEYRFAEGETPNIPQTIEQNGFTYHLVSQTEPVLESSLPTVRTYTYRIDGLLTQQQIDEYGLKNIKLTPVNVVHERKVDVELSHVNTSQFKNMPTNDVDDIPLKFPCRVSSGTDPSGYETKLLDRAGVTFEIAGFEGGLSGSPTPPAGYNATVIYRGVETYAEVGYYKAEATFTTSETEDGVSYYVIVATYETEAFDPPIEEFIAEPVIPGAPEAIEVIDDGIHHGHTIFDIFSGDVPLGGFFYEGAWSLISAILSIGGLLIASAYAVGTLMRKRYVSTLVNMGVYDEKWLKMVRQRGVILRILTIVLGVITLITWLFLEDFSNGFVWVNINTPIILILFAITMALCIFTNMRERRIFFGDLEESDEVDNAAGGGAA